MEISGVSPETGGSVGDVSDIGKAIKNGQNSNIVNEVSGEITELDTVQSGTDKTKTTEQKNKERGIVEKLKSAENTGKATLDFKDIDGVKGSKHPWLKPNGLAAMMICLQELAKEQSRIKLKSSEVWMEDIKEAYALSKEIAQTVILSSQIQADMTKLEADRHRMNATMAFISAGTSFAMAGVTFGMAKFSAYKQAKYETAKQAKTDAAQQGKTDTAQQGKTDTDQSPAPEPTSRSGAKVGLQQRSQSTPTLQRPTTTKAEGPEVTVQPTGAGGAGTKVTTTPGQGSRVQVSDKNKIDAKLDNKADLKQPMDPMTMSHTMNMVHSGLTSALDGAKSWQNADIDIEKSDMELIKGLWDAQREKLQGVKGLYEKDAGFWEQVGRDAGSLMDKSLEMAKDASQRYGQIGIGLRPT